VPEVIDEVRDGVSKLKLSGMNIKIIEPNEKSIGKIKNIAKRTGDLKKLSDTDKKVLALALEKNDEIISDDYNIQNVAERLKIRYTSLFNKKISRFIEWKNYCKNCNKYFEKEICPICGSRLSRRAKRQVKVYK